MIEYKLVFEKHGELKRCSELMNNEIWLDVGNSLGSGYFDHHQLCTYESTYSVLLDNLDFLNNISNNIKENKSLSVTIHMHEEPDMDCISSYFALRFYLEHGRDEFVNLFVNNEKGKKLKTYLDDIDAGRNKITSYPTLYGIFSMIGNGRRNSEETNNYIVERGLRLFSGALDILFAEDNINLATHNLSGCIDGFEKEISTIKKCYDEYKEDKSNNRVLLEDISVWTKSGELKRNVKAAIWKNIPLNYIEYNFAREEGNVITVVPYTIKRSNGSETTRVFISVNPDIDKKGEYTLLSLAEIIEQMEQLEEQRLYEQTGVYRRDHSRPRANEGLFFEMPFGATSDPWYISEKHDVIDAPRIQSLLDYEDIQEIIRNNGSMVKKSFALSINEENALGDMKIEHTSKEISLCGWKKQISKLIKNANTHIIVWAELDASLIRKHNKLLEAYCMSLVGRSNNDKKSDNILYIDYRTCIYSDLDCTIILIATHEGYKEKELITSDIIDTNNIKNLEGSLLIQKIKALVHQRLQLLKFGEEIGELRTKRRKEIERLNDNILVFSEQIQKDDMIRNPVLREIYEFIQKEFKIAELKTSVMEEMSIIVNESRDKLVSKFNILSAFAVPFILIATLFQMGIIKFEEIVELTGVPALVGWGVITILIIILVFIFGGIKKGKKID